MEPVFVDAYDTNTGIKQVVPLEWLDHPVLGANLSLTPLSKRQRVARGDQPDNPTPTPVAGAPKE